MSRTPENQIAEAAPQEVSDLKSVARRKAILKGLGKTAAVAGAAAPLSSLATARLKYSRPGDSKKYHCSVSGQMSVLASTGAANVTSCSAMTPTQYKCNTSWNANTLSPVTAGSWPQWPRSSDGNSAATISRDGQLRTPAATLSAVFGGGVLSLVNTPIGTILTSNGSSDEAHWITALLNAQRYSSSTFPHTPAEVFAHYHSGSTGSANALAFYKLINKA